MPTPLPGPTPGAAPLAPAEVAAFEKRLDQWDAFLVFAIKQLGVSTHNPTMREQLFQLLLDSRYRLLQASQNPTSGGPDPVRILFLKEWRVRPTRPITAGRRTPCDGSGTNHGANA